MPHAPFPPAEASTSGQGSVAANTARTAASRRPVVVTLAEGATIAEPRSLGKASAGATIALTLPLSPSCHDTLFSFKAVRKRNVDGGESGINYASP